MDREEEPNHLEPMMRNISLATSLLGVGLMIFGFLEWFIQGGSSSMPGVAVLPPMLIRPATGVSPALRTMGAGIVVLALLPIVRVLLALSLYARNRQVLNVAVALLVFIELLVSLRTGA
jgi:uncharacterized membrane protein